MRANYGIAVLLVGSMLGGCDLGPVGTPPPLTRIQAQGVLTCQHAIKTAAAAFVNTKLRKLGDCADKILALQLALENGLITQAVFDTKIEIVRQQCETLFADIGKASTAMANVISSKCVPVQDIILSAYDPLQFVALGDASSPVPALFGSIASLDDIIGYNCLTAELFADSALFYNIPRLIPLLDLVGLDLGVPLDSRCGSI